MNPTRVRRALLSVSDKTGLVDFAQGLVRHGIDLISTGGTYKTLKEAGLAVREISEYTGFPEMLDGRVKTLHPKVHGGILHRRDLPEHVVTIAQHQIEPIDMVVVNLYPFEATVARPDVSIEEAIENIDIGGPSMIRSAAKNHDHVAVVTDPAQYAGTLAELDQHQGTISRTFLRQLAIAAFERTSRYDAAIHAYLAKSTGTGTPFPEDLHLVYKRESILRYGENPHQQAAFYSHPNYLPASLARARKRHGKELSYNNLLDLDSALAIVREFDRPAVAIIKHNNPCGVGLSKTLSDAFLAAWDGDPLSAFGGILAFNRPVDADTASALMDPKAKRFIECVIAPDYEPHALDALKKWKENVRLLKTGPLSGFPEGLDYRRVDGGLLVQSRDFGADKPDDWKCVTDRKPTENEWHSLHFAWFVCKHVKSNAIVLASNRGDKPLGCSIVGVGAGQMSRVVSVEIAVRKAGDKSKGSVLASDAFFPFPDNVELAAAAGVTAIIQPGGSVKDADSIAACNKHGIAMLFTGMRHFRH